MTTRGAQAVAFDRGGLDVWSTESVFEVTRERLVEYAEATNDPIPAHRAGDVANPVFAIVPAFDSLLEPALDVVPTRVLGRVVHGEQDFRFHRPIRPGDTLVSRGRMTGWRSGPSGTAACVQLECRDRAGALVNTQYVTFFLRGVDAGDTVGALAPEHRFDDSLQARPPVATLTQHVDDDQTFRYGPAAGDPMPIHLDAEVAREAGLPGIIAHGLCVQAFTAWGVLTEVAVADVTRLGRLAVRFARPVLPGQDITTSIWRAGSAAGVTSYRYRTVVGETVVLTDGLAEITD